MKTTHIISVALLMGGMWGSFFGGMAQNEVPCLIFKGESQEDCRVDLSVFNRITFVENGMLLTSSKNVTEEEVLLLYSMYNRMETGAAIPTISVDVDKIVAESNDALHFDAAAKTIHLQSGSDKEFAIGVFTPEGAMAATAKISADMPLSLQNLASGIYIAIATDGKTSMTLKLILK